MMTTNNLAIIFSPTFMGGSDEYYMKSMDSFEKAFTDLIENTKEVFKPKL